MTRIVDQVRTVIILVRIARVATVRLDQWTRGCQLAPVEHF